MRSKRRVLTLLGIVLLMSAGVARADVIDFDTLGPTGTNLANGDPIPDDFGSTPDYAVTYGTQVDFNTNPVRPYLSFFGFAGNMLNVAYVNNLDPGGGVPNEPEGLLVGRVAISAVAGKIIDLIAFDLGMVGDSLTDGEAFVEVYDSLSSGGTRIFIETGPTIDAVTGRQVSTPGVSAQTINIQWLNASQVAIDNIRFLIRDANPIVPEPATMVSWLLGVGALGFVAYRRRRLARG